MRQCPLKYKECPLKRPLSGRVVRSIEIQVAKATNEKRTALPKRVRGRGAGLSTPKNEHINFFKPKWQVPSLLRKAAVLTKYFMLILAAAAFTQDRIPKEPVRNWY